MPKEKPAAPTRFVLQLIDTKNTHGSGKAEQYLSWAIGFDDFARLSEPIHEEDGGTELQRWLNFVKEQTDKVESDSKGYSAFEVKS